MKTFDLCACGVAEMTQQEMLEIDGGNIFGDAWNWIKGAAEDVAEWTTEYVKEHGDEILTALLIALLTGLM
jgi:hypothetical protein